MSAWKYKFLYENQKNSEIRNCLLQTICEPILYFQALTLSISFMSGILQDINRKSFIYSFFSKATVLSSTGHLYILVNDRRFFHWRYYNANRTVQSMYYLCSFMTWSLTNFIIENLKSDPDWDIGHAMHVVRKGSWKVREVGKYFPSFS